MACDCGRIPDPPHAPFERGKHCGRCTVRARADSPTDLQWVSTARLIRDAVALAGKLPDNCAGVVGVPRSGMIPAAVIATHLHLPLYSITDAGLTRLSAGPSRGAGVEGGNGPLAVVDDTTYTGGAMARVRKVLGETPALFCAVYTNPHRVASEAVVDLSARPLPAPHLLEWNFANNGPVRGRAADPQFYAGGIGFDLDGVIVHDAESGGVVGSPYLTPRMHPVPLIATGRPEATRAQTESLLARLGVRYDRLEMYPGNRLASGPEIAAFKARVFAASKCGMFAESDPAQAEAINLASRKPVICPRADRVYQLRPDPTPATPRPKPTVKHPLPCLALGPVTDRVRCNCPRKHGYQCLKGHGVVRPVTNCETCPDYEADDASGDVQPAAVGGGV